MFVAGKFQYLFECRVSQRMNLFERFGLKALDLTREQFADVIGCRGIFSGDEVRPQRFLTVPDFQILIAEFQSDKESCRVKSD